MLNNAKVCAVIVAAGASRRMGFDKLFAPIGGETVLSCSVAAFCRHPMVDQVVVVTSPANLDKVTALAQTIDASVKVVPGGARRQDSVAAGVAAAEDASWLAIHDGARPYISESVITKALLGAVDTGCAAPAVPVKDTVKIADTDGTVVSTPDRSTLFAVQTPQVVDRQKYLAALQKLGDADVTDDCSVMEYAGFGVRLTQGEYANIKITTPEDLPQALSVQVRPEKHSAVPVLRIGHGYDVHRLVEQRALILGGVTVPFEKGLLGHSDADVLLHAVMDALLGAAALGDIGKHFPDNDKKWKGADSTVLLQAVCRLVRDEGWQIGNIDATVLCQKPKLAGFIPQMRAVTAAKMGVLAEQVSIKATTEEKLGFTGAGEGIAAHCVAMLYR